MNLYWSTTVSWRLEGSGGLNAEIDAETNPEDVVFLFPDHSFINSENGDNKVKDI